MVWETYEGSRDSEGRCGSVYCGAGLGISRLCLAGVDVPDSLIEGWRLSLPGPPAAAARSAEAWEMLAAGTLVVLACAWVEMFVIPLAVEAEGVLMLLVLSELDDLCLREGVGCVAPVS